jgi:hypothetical protein
MPSNSGNAGPNYGESYVFLFLQDEDDLESALKQKQDEFLDVYSFYRRAKLPIIKQELLRKAYELSVLDPKFTFYI